MAKAGTTSKKRKTIGTGKPKTIEITYMDGVNIADESSLVEALSTMVELEEQLKPVLKSIELTRNQAATYMHSHAKTVAQLDGCYFRKIQRVQRWWDPDKIKQLVKGKKDKNGKPLWNFITKRVPDPEKIDQAVSQGLVSQKHIDKAYLSAPGNPYIQRFQGVAFEEEDDA